MRSSADRELTSNEGLGAALQPPRRPRLHLARLACATALLAAIATCALGARGGPDAGGWGWADSDDLAVDTSIEVPGALNMVANPVADDGVYPITLSFPFTFYGVTTNTIWISSNGWISFVNPGVGPAASEPTNRSVPDGSAPHAGLYYLWDDLDTGGFIQEGATATGHILLVRHMMKGTGSLFQAWIHFRQNGSIKVVYVVNPEIGSATIGIEDETSGVGSELSFNGLSAAGLNVRGDYAVLYYPIAAPNCAAAIPTGCGASVAGSTLGGGTDIARYGCSGFTYSGHEEVYSLDLTALTQLDVGITNVAPRDQDLMLLRAECDGTLGCVAGGADFHSLPMLGAGTYYLAIDGKTVADDGGFNLDVTCNPISTPITCGGTINGNIAAGASGISSYGCRAGDFSGAERIYTFTTATPKTIVAQLTPAAPFDLILADQATMTPVTSACMKRGDSELGVLRLPPGSYALIVDGPVGAAGAFSLTLDCFDQIPAVPIACGDVAVPGSNTGPSLIDFQTSCGRGAFGRGEEYYRFRPPSRVIATVSHSLANYELFSFREASIPTTCAGTAVNNLRLANLGLEDHLFVLDSNVTSGPTSLSVSCSNMTTAPLTCGTTISSTTVGPGQIDNYSCLASGLAGGERFFLLDNPLAQSFAVGVSSVADLDIVAFDGPFNANAPACTAGGDKVARWPAAAPGQYLVVVDGPAGSDGAPFDITVTCGDSAIDCAAAPVLGCNQVLQGTTVGGTTTAAIYGTTDELFTGPERAYSFTVPGPGPMAVSFALQNASDPRLDLVLLDACDPNSVVAYGDEWIIRPQLAPGSYTVVVDGRDGASGSYDLISFCGGPSIEPTPVSVVLEPGQCHQETVQVFFPPSVPVADVMFSFDLSGSMGEELNQAKTNTTDIYNALNGLIPSLQFGIASFVEYGQPYTDTVCGFTHNPSAPDPYPFKIHQALTSNIAQVDAALQNMNLVGGAYETYTRTFWESYSNPGIGWRECARKLWLSFGDEPPMDCNAYECIGLMNNTGRDPGDGFITGDANDIILLPTIDAMAANGIVLIPVDSSEDTDLIAMWQCLAERTGGNAIVTDRRGRIADGTNIVDSLVSVIVEAIRRCPEVTLEASAPYAGWVTVNPTSYIDVWTPWYGEFTVDYCVPPGTPAGFYDLTVAARCLGAGNCATELLGEQEVRVEVPEPCPVPPVAAASPAPEVCIGETVPLDGAASTDCGGGGLRYRWLDGGGFEVCPWSLVSTCDVVPPVGTSRYTLEVECIDRPTCVSSTDLDVTVLPEPYADLAPRGPYCIGDSVDLSAAASDPLGCPVPLEYRFRAGANLLRDWDLSPLLPGLTPAVTTTYTVDVRCTAAPGCAASSDMTAVIVPPPTAVAGPGANVCEMIPVTLDASGSGDPGCPGGLEYQWREGANVVRGWGPATWSPPTDTVGLRTYTVEVRCVGLPGCADSDAVEVRVRLCALAVSFDYFAAARNDDGTITITWGTLSEDGTRAFAIERAVGVNGPYHEVARVGAHGPYSPYEVVDDMAPAGSEPWYRIVERTTSGAGDATPPFTLAPDEVDPRSEKNGGGKRTRSRQIRK